MRNTHTYIGTRTPKLLPQIESGSHYKRTHTLLTHLESRFFLFLISEELVRQIPNTDWALVEAKLILKSFLTEIERNSFFHSHLRITITSYDFQRKSDWCL